MSIGKVGCVFCDIIQNKKYDFEYNDCVIFSPLAPIVPGHKLIVPINHAKSAAYDPQGAAKAMEVASQMVYHLTFGGDPPWPEPQANIITSCGTDATQTIKHTHLHVVPRTAHDGLALPWTDQLSAEVWTRDDGWSVSLTRVGERISKISSLPAIVETPPIPLTYEYVMRALEANGYARQS